MPSLLHAVWFHDHENDAAALDASIEGYLKLLDSAGDVARRGAYSVVPGGPDIQWVKSTVAHLDDHPAESTDPAAFVIAEVGSMPTALDLARQLGTADGPEDKDVAPYGVFSQALFHEIAYVPGPEEDEGGDLGAAVQLGTFGVKTVRDQWRLSEWYEYTRHPEVATIPGTIRTRRYVSVCARAKFGILYEFTSLEARLEGFERPMEGRFQDASHPTAQLGTYTVHAPGAPYIGVQRFA